jgi:hypothetical protein
VGLALNRAWKVGTAAVNLPASLMSAPSLGSKSDI